MSRLHKPYPRLLSQTRFAELCSVWTGCEPNHTPCPPSRRSLGGAAPTPLGLVGVQKYTKPAQPAAIGRRQEIPTP